MALLEKFFTDVSGFIFHLLVRDLKYHFALILQYYFRNRPLPIFSTRFFLEDWRRPQSVTNISRPSIFVPKMLKIKQYYLDWKKMAFYIPVSWNTGIFECLFEISHWVYFVLNFLDLEIVASAHFNLVSLFICSKPRVRMPPRGTHRTQVRHKLPPKTMFGSPSLKVVAWHRSSGGGLLNYNSDTNQACKIGHWRKHQKKSPISIKCVTVFCDIFQFAIIHNTQ